VEPVEVVQKRVGGNGSRWKTRKGSEGVREVRERCGRFRGGAGGSEEVREVRRRSGRPWESAEEAGKAREVTVRYRNVKPLVEEKHAILG